MVLASIWGSNASYAYGNLGSSKAIIFCFFRLLLYLGKNTSFNIYIPLKPCSHQAGNPYFARKIHLDGSNFKIYSASAGSGKTYALAKTYLKLLLSNDSAIKFRQILAITFTNKAVDEMKSRILDNLFAFGQDVVPEKQEAITCIIVLLYLF